MRSISGCAACVTPSRSPHAARSAPPSSTRSPTTASPPTTARSTASRRILLDALGADDERGGHPLGSFLVDMNALFERFVAAWLAAHLPASLELSRQHPVDFDRARTKHLRADLVLVHEGTPLLLADTKYRLSAGKPADAELYQVLAYARALQLHHAVLLYPDVPDPPRPLVVRDGANTIHVDGLDLARPWPEVEAALHRLLARMLAVATEQNSAA
jgi:5-methylcytosine-specific restriction enzyme subunit McrC